LSRFVTNIAWVIPVIYVFWPRLRLRDRIVKKERKSINANAVSIGLSTGGNSSMLDENLSDDEEESMAGELV